MARYVESDPALKLVDDLLRDLAARSAMYVGRRRQGGDATTFVIQTGEEGRHRLEVPMLHSDDSIRAVAEAAQAYLQERLEQLAPLCPLHEHPLLATVARGRLRWTCPAGDWRCELGDYEEASWPQLELGTSLGPILMRRLRRRGMPNTVRTIAVRRHGANLVAEFGLTEQDRDATAQITAAAQPLAVSTHYSPPRMITPLPHRRP